MTRSRSDGQILFYSTLDGGAWGGSEELWFETALRMAEDGWSVAASVLRWPEPPAQLATLRSRKVAVIERGVPPALLRALHKVRPEQKHGWLEKLNPRWVLLSQGSNWSLRTIEAAESLIARNIPYAIVSHCGYPWYWPPDGLAARMRTAYAKAKVAYFVSNANLTLTRMQVADPISNARIVRNPFGVDYDHPLPWPEGDVVRLACVSRLDPGVKGLDLLCQAMASEVWRRRKVLVTIYGRGPHAEIVRSLQQSFAIQSVESGGFAAPRDIWSKNHGLILSSRAEGLPIAIVEAMLCGRVCIATDVGGNSEVIDDGETGFLAREVSAAGIGAALERAWQRVGDWQSMSERAAKKIRAIVPRDPVADLVKDLERSFGDSVRDLSRTVARGA